MNRSKLSRRDFLKLARTAILTVSGLFGLAGLFRFLDFQPDPPAPAEFDLGPAADFPPGSRTVLPVVPAILLHSADGFTALSLVCTHLGCTVKSQTDGFACPCHGSRYDLQGKVTRGPAIKPLPTLRVEATPDGKLRLFTT